MFKWLKNLFKNQEANAERVDAFVGGWEIHTAIHINGTEIPIVGWERVSKTGKKMIAGGKSIPREPKATQDDWQVHDASSDVPF